MWARGGFFHGVTFQVMPPCGGVWGLNVSKSTQSHIVQLDVHGGHVLCGAGCAKLDLLRVKQTHYACKVFSLCHGYSPISMMWRVCA
jgi:hypothetical protein